jgi:hypothetical protein
MIVERSESDMSVSPIVKAIIIAHTFRQKYTITYNAIAIRKDFSFEVSTGSLLASSLIFDKASLAIDPVPIVR